MKRQTGSILVLSLPKSGSSMAYQSLCEAFPTHETNMELLEHARISEIRGKLLCKQVFVSAAAVRRQRDRLDCFDKLVALVRDPRDRIVSAMLYAAYNVVKSPTESLPRRLLALLGQKERMPSAVSCVEIIRNMADDVFRLPSMGADLELPDLLAEAKSSPRPLAIIRYEDLLQGDGWRRLSEHVGVEVGPPQVFTPLLQRVRRSARSGDWRHWFTPEDVDAFRPLFSDLLARYAYDPDWTLASPQLLDPEHGSLFVDQCIGLALRRRVQ